MNAAEQQFLLRTLRRLLAQLPVTRSDLGRAIDIVAVPMNDLSPLESKVLTTLRSDRRALVLRHHTTLAGLRARGLVTDEGELTPEGKRYPLKGRKK